MREHLISLIRQSRRLTPVKICAISLVIVVAVFCELVLSRYFGVVGACGPLLLAVVSNTIIGGLWPSVITQVVCAGFSLAVLPRPFSTAIPEGDIWSFAAFLLVAKLSAFLLLSLRHSQDLVLASERMQSIAQATHDCIWDWDIESGQVWRAGKITEIFGCSPEQVVADIEWWRLRVDPEQQSEVWNSLQFAIRGTADSWDFEYKLRQENGSFTIVSDRARILRNKKGVAVRVLGGMADISVERRAEERLLQQASRDFLTGLPNRGVFLKDFEKSGPRSLHRAILFIDVDQFKAVNDSFGPQAGDELLVGMSHRLKLHLRSGDLAARFGGDEFAVLLDRVQGPSDALHIARDLLQSLHEPFQLAGRTVSVSASIGIAFSDQGSPLDLLQQADRAMHQAKRQGGGRCQVFDSALDDRARARRQMEFDLSRSFQDGSLRLYYQPIIAVNGGGLTSFEALLRWQHPRNSMIYPGEILSIAEDAGLSVRLGQWVLGETCERLRAWRSNQAVPSLDINVNLSGTDFSRPALVDEVRTLLRETGIPGESLIIELTETTIMESNVDAARRLSRLRDMGVRLALDDFGKGHSSLGRLQDFPISILKIDSSFVKQIGLGNRQILDAIIALAHELHLEITAEGVETPEQLIYLRDKGAAKVQGLLFAPALDYAAATEVLVRPLWNLEDLMNSQPEHSAGFAAG